MMETVFLSHLLISAALCAAVAISNPFIRSPQLRNALWTLVLLKLIVPPIALWSVPTVTSVSVDLSPTTQLEMKDNAKVVAANTAIPDAPRGLHSALRSTGSEAFLSEASENTSRRWNAWPYWLFLLWGIGSAIYGLLVARQFLQLRKLVAFSNKAPSAIDQVVESLGQTLGLKKLPVVRFVDAAISPLVCSLNFQSVLLLPSKLVSSLSDVQLETVIAHELAHLRRYDHLVRWLEVVTITIFWWNPTAWFAQRKLRETEEECCDAWVVWALPDRRRSYGLALLQTNEFLTDGVVTTPSVASAFGRTFFKRRIEMIMKSHLHRHMSRFSLGVFITLSCVVLPVGAQQQDNSDGEKTTQVPALPSKASGDLSARQLEQTSTPGKLNQPGTAEALAAIRGVCEANGIKVSEEELHFYVEQTASKFTMPTARYLGLILEHRGITESQYKTEMVWPMIALRKLSELDDPQAMVPIVEEYLQTIKAGQSSQSSKEQQNQAPGLSPAATKDYFELEKASEGTESKSALLRSEVEFLRAKVKFLEAQLQELKSRN